MPLAAIPTSASPADHRAGGADALADTSDAAARCGTVTVALPANIEMIPDEVLLGILSDLDFASRHSVGRVNRRFHRLLEPGFAAGRMLARIRWLQAPADVAIALRDIGALERDYQPALLAELATRLRTQGFPSAPAGLAAVLDATMRLPPPLQVLSLTAMLEADNGMVPLELLARIDLLVPTLPQAVQPEMRALGMVAMWRQDDDREDGISRWVQQARQLDVDDRAKFIIALLNDRYDADELALPAWSALLAATLQLPSADGRPSPYQPRILCELAAAIEQLPAQHKAACWDALLDAGGTLPPDDGVQVFAALQKALAAEIADIPDNMVRAERLLSAAAAMSEEARIAVEGLRLAVCPDTFVLLRWPVMLRAIDTLPADAKARQLEMHAEWLFQNADNDNAWHSLWIATLDRVGALPSAQMRSGPLRALIGALEANDAIRENAQWWFSLICRLPARVDAHRADLLAMCVLPSGTLWSGILAQTLQLPSVVRYRPLRRLVRCMPGNSALLDLPYSWHQLMDAARPLGPTARGKVVAELALAVARLPSPEERMRARTRIDAFVRDRAMPLRAAFVARLAKLGGHAEVVPMLDHLGTGPESFPYRAEILRRAACNAQEPRYGVPMGLQARRAWEELSPLIFALPDESQWLPLAALRDLADQLPESFRDAARREIDQRLNGLRGGHQPALGHKRAAAEAPMARS